MLHSRGFIVLFLLLGFVGSAHALKWSDTYILPPATTITGISPQAIAIDHNGNANIAYWYSHASFFQEVYYSKVSPDGQTLVGPLLVRQCNINNCLVSRISMALDSLDNVHIVWGEDDVDSHIKYKKLGTQGQTLINTKDLITPVPNLLGFYQYPQIGIDTLNNIHLIWTGSTDSHAAKSGISYQVFSNMATPISSPLIAFQDSSSGGYNLHKLAMSPSGNANVVAIRIEPVTQARSIMYRKFSQSGNPLIGPTTLVSTSSSGGDFQSATLAIDVQENIHLSYFDKNVNNPNSVNIKYQKFNSNAQSIGNSLKLGQPQGDCIYETCTAIAILPVGTVGVAWNGNSDNNVSAATISAGGTIDQLFSPLVNQDTSTSFIFMTAGSDNMFHLTWDVGQVSGPTFLGWSIAYKHTLPEKAVILVHGIYSDDSIWNAVETELKNKNYAVYRIGKVNGKKGLVPNNGDIFGSSEQLKDAIKIVKEKTKLAKVDIVAHSMGGLVSRTYIKSNEYAGDVNNLVMLGTPNEGAPIAAGNLAKILGLTGDSGFDTARLQMLPGSYFLNFLNNGYTTKGVHHTALATTYTMFILQSRPVNVHAETDQLFYSAGQPIKITATLFDENAVPSVGWNVKARTFDNAGINWNVQLYDDGTHGDTTANDGVYVNSFTPSSVNGILIFTIQASGTYQRHPYNLTGITTASVIILPDLELAPRDVQLAQVTPQTTNYTLSTTVKNSGTVAVTNAVIRFYDGFPADGGKLIGQTTVSLTPGQSAQASVPWASTPGIHTIYITPASNNAFTDADYSNEVATRTIGCLNSPSTPGMPAIKGCTLVP